MIARTVKGVRLLCSEASTTNSGRGKFGDVKWSDDGRASNTDTEDNTTYDNLWYRVASCDDYSTRCEAANQTRPD